MKLTHELCFDNKGKTQSVLLEIDGEDPSDEQVAKILSEQLKALKIKN